MYAWTINKPHLTVKGKASLDLSHTPSIEPPEGCDTVHSSNSCHIMLWWHSWSATNINIVDTTIVSKTQPMLPSANRFQYYTQEGCADTHQSNKHKHQSKSSNQQCGSQLMSLFWTWMEMEAWQTAQQPSVAVPCIYAKESQLNFSGTNVFGANWAQCGGSLCTDKSSLN